MAQGLGELEKIALLLADARERRYSDVMETVYLCELAQALAGRLDLNRYGALRVADMRARVWAELGNAYRLADHLDLAEEAIEQAMRFFEAGSGNSGLLALIADRLATYLCHRRSYGEAFAVLDRLAEFYVFSGNPHLAGRTLIKRGLYTEYAGEPRRAAEITCRALELVEPEHDSALTLAGVHNILMCAVNLGHFKLADRLLPKVEPLYGTDRLNLLRHSWVKGRVAAGLGRTDSAERTFLAVRAGFSKAGLIFPASLVSLELALVWMAQGRTEEIAALTQELVVSFGSLQVEQEVIASLLLLRRATEEQASLDEIRRRILEVASVIKAAEARPR